MTLSSPPPLDARPRKIVIDCDPGWDDALALILLTADRSPNVIGITTVSGNGTVTNSTTNARHLAAFLDVPGLVTYEGCSQRLPYTGPGPAPSAAMPCHVVRDMRPLGPYGNLTAVDFLIASAQKYGSDLLILATAPLTNIATAFAKNPDAMKTIGGIVCVGGAWKGGGTDEFNLSQDPTATVQLLAAGVNIWLIPFETCQQLTNATVLQTIQSRGTPLDLLYAAIVTDQLTQGNAEAATGLYDAVGALVALDFGLSKGVSTKIRIDPPYQGTIVQVGADDPGGHYVYIVTVKDVAKAYQFVFDRLAMR